MIFCKYYRGDRIFLEKILLVRSQFSKCSDCLKSQAIAVFRRVRSHTVSLPSFCL
ncbi:MAG: hypothetical protein KME54_05315 [Tolypothrix brevis GSE-NOS-MK-07-07A]|nr:hypothetical protein [Tolypothrix brevis GSE-NOS-MK-07-07A]